MLSNLSPKLPSLVYLPPRQCSKCLHYVVSRQPWQLILLLENSGSWSGYFWYMEGGVTDEFLSW